MDGPARIPAMVALCFALLVPGASPATARANDTAPPPETESAILDDVFDDFLSAYNRRSFGALRELYETRFTTAALEDRFSGPAGAARERLRLYHHYGPLERVAIDSAGPGRVYWARGTVSGGWLGFEWVPTVAGERVERAILWRLTLGHHAKFRALGSEVAADSVARYLASMEDAGLFSGVVLVAQGDEVLLEEAYGLADRKNDVANKVDTRFNIASAGKLFTGVALMQLAERGQLGLDDPVTEYVPEYPAEVGARTTIGHLLEHTSQIELDDIQPYREAAPKVPTLEALIDLQIRILQTEDVRVQPGGGFDYSNEAIDLAGLILQRASGRGWIAYLEEELFGSAGMIHTGFLPSPDSLALAVGHTLTKGEERSGIVRQAVDYRDERTRPSGRQFSTARDLFRFARALFGGLLLTQGTLERMTDPRQTLYDMERFDAAAHYGYTMMIQRTGDVIWLGHAGGEPGAGAQLRHYPRLDRTVIVLSNAGQFAAYVVASQLETLLGET